MRAFIAIDLEESLKNALEALISELRPLTRNVRWVGAAAMHLTLKFLGEVQEEKAARIISILKAAAARHHTFGLVLEGTGAFPPGRKDPRVFWAGVVPEPRLLALQEDIEKEMEKIGLERENRRFQPHLTLGRVKFPSGLDLLAKELNKYQAHRFGGMSVKKFTFFQSTIKPAGAEYSVLGEFPIA